MKSIQSVLRLSRSALIATVVAMGALTGTASAAVPGLELVSATSPIDSAASKAVTVTCPAGKKLIGSGGQINGPAGQVVLDEITPLPNQTSVTVVAAEAGAGTAATWSVKAYAICANAPAGLQLVSATSPIDSAASKAITVSCPAGKKLIGSGGQLNGPAGQVVLDEITPLPNQTSVTVVAAEAGAGIAATWSVKAYAICANALAGLQQVSATSPINSAASKVVTVSCPAGKKLIGSGGQINGPAGQVVLDEITPLPNQISATVVAAEIGAGTAATWSIKAYAICATP